MVTKIIFVLALALSLSTAQSIQWQKLNGPVTYDFEKIEIDKNDYIYALTESGMILKSEDLGLNWYEIRTHGIEGKIYDIKINTEGWIFAASYYVIPFLYVSKDHGQNWINLSELSSYTVSPASPSKIDRPINIDLNDNLYLRQSETTIIKSTDHGENWSDPGWNFSISLGTSLIIDDQGYFYITSVNNKESFFSRDNDTSWQKIDSAGIITNIFSNSSGDIFFKDLINGVFRSPDNGKSWSRLEHELLPRRNYWLQIDKNDNLYISSPSIGIIKSSDNGQSWHKFDKYSFNELYPLNAHDKLLARRSCDGFFITEVFDALWSPIDIPVYEYVNEMYTFKYNDIIYAKTGCMWMQSSDRGASWSPVNSNFPNSPQKMISTSDGTIYALSGSNLLISYDDGNTWQNQSAIPGKDILLFDQNENLYCSNNSSRKTFRSTDQGSTWEEILHNAALQHIAPVGENYLFAIAERIIGPCGVYISEDNGANWDFLDLSEKMDSFIREENHFNVLVSDKNGYLFLYEYWGGGDGMFFQSKDLGNSWININSNFFYNGRIDKIIVNSENHFFTVVTDPTEPITQLLGSWYDGRHWGKRENGLKNKFVRSIHIDNLGFLYARTGGTDYADSYGINPKYAGIYRSVLPTRIAESNKELPFEFSLTQNYPNPFNPETVIEYSLPIVERNSVSLNGHERFRESLYKTTLKVFDILGREVATLVDKPQGPGNYKVRFNAIGLASGVYIYRLKYGTHTQSRKMLLLR